MSDYYRPAHDDEQLLAGDPYGSRSCLAYAAATAMDFHSLGALRPTGRQVREASDDPTASVGGIGLNLGNIDVAWRKLAGEPLQHTYQGTWAQLRARREEDRYVLMTGRYGALPILSRCQKDFTGPHGIALSPSNQEGGRWIVDDPLCTRSLGHAEATLRAYALALHPDGLLQFGWTDAHPPIPVPAPPLEEDSMIALSIARWTVPAGTQFAERPGGPLVGTLAASRFTTIGTPAGWPGWRALVRHNRQVVYVPLGALTSLPNWPHGEALQTALMDGRLPAADCADEVATATAPLIARIDIIKSKAAAFGADVSDD